MAFASHCFQQPPRRRPATTGKPCKAASRTAQGIKLALAPDEFRAKPLDLLCTVTRAAGQFQKFLVDRKIIPCLVALNRLDPATRFIFVRELPTAKGGWASGFCENRLPYGRTYIFSTGVTSGDSRPSLIIPPLVAVYH